MVYKFEEICLEYKSKNVGIVVPKTIGTASIFNEVIRIDFTNLSTNYDRKWYKFQKDQFTTFSYNSTGLFVIFLMIFSTSFCSSNWT